MIIDFHTHIFPTAIAPSVIEKLSQASGTLPYTNGTEQGLLASMHQAGITYSVTLPVATNPEKVSHINRSAVLDCEEEKLIRFGAMHPDCADWKEELRTLAHNGCRGIKIHPVYQNVNLNDKRYLRILDEAGALGLIVVTHTGYDIGFPGVVRCSPAMALHAIREVGPVKLVLAHMGGWRCWEAATELLAETDVLLDTSFSAGQIALRNNTVQNKALGLLNKEQLTEMIHTFGAHRILFGTDSPWSGQLQSVQCLQALPLSKAEIEQILWKNAAKLLHL